MTRAEAMTSYVESDRLGDAIREFRTLSKEEKTAFVSRLLPDQCGMSCECNETSTDISMLTGTWECVLGICGILYLLSCCLDGPLGCCDECCDFKDDPCEYCCGC